MEAMSHPTPLPEALWSRVDLDYTFRYHFFLFFGQVQGRVLLCTPCVEVAGVAVRTWSRTALTGTRSSLPSLRT